MLKSLTETKDIKSVLFGVILLVVVFRLNIFKLLSKILELIKTVNDCIKTILILVPLFFVVKNIKTVKGFLDFLGFFDNSGIYKTAKDLSLQLNSNKNKRKVSEPIKKQIAANQKWSCGHCNEILDASYEIDHIKPLYKNGSNDMSNLMALCRNCHGKKTINDKITN